MAKESISRSKIDATELALNDKLIYINRVSKVLKGGKRLSFAALVVSGDGAGHVGIGLGKSNEVPEAINKANAVAHKHLINVQMAGNTIPYEVTAKFGAAQVLLKPAAPGIGIIAGGSVRAVVEAAGIKDILTKSLGSANKANVAKAVMLALSSLKDPKKELAKRKGEEKPQEASGG
ncbi:MAG: 30S ribosomal protein S5 [Dehalococcoidia bacterium]|nr:MAG: 30S ribosomal protein S5 [Dehalococcoidia bacterium]